MEILFWSHPHGEDPPKSLGFGVYGLGGEGLPQVAPHPVKVIARDNGLIVSGSSYSPIIPLLQGGGST